MRKTSVEMADIVRDYVAREGVASQDALEVAALNEETVSLMGHDVLVGAHRVVETLLRRQPGFVPALNNLSQIEYLDGHLDHAIATVRRALEARRGDFHALVNLVHFQLLAGQPDEAKQTAEQLKAVGSERADPWVKTAEALVKLGDDEGVLATYARAWGATQLDLKHYDEAKEPPKLLLSRQKLHVSEFSALCNPNVTMHDAEGDRDVARS